MLGALLMIFLLPNYQKAFFSYFVNKLKYDAVDLSNLQLITTIIYSLLLFCYNKIFKNINFFTLSKSIIITLLFFCFANSMLSYDDYSN